MHIRQKVTFVHSADKTYSETQMFGVHFLPVWAYTLASHLSEIGQFNFQILDDRIQSVDSAQESDFFLYTGMNQDLTAIKKNRAYLAKKFPKSKHLIGGPICWSFQKAGKIQSLNEFDHIFIGDGEDAIQDFFRGEKGKIIETTKRFDLHKSKMMHRELLEATMKNYYGTVIEVSRGCPFLCEFCDIRVLPDNNRSHVKNPSTILEEIDFFATRGVNQIILACDNFIGNSLWAEELCDQIIEWKNYTGLSPGFYTWLSIDIAKHPRLLTKLKQAGIDMLFIGVESFHKNSLIETSKIQNTKIDMVEEIRKIQSHGLIVVAGLIFGFDTDPNNIVEITLKGILDSGLISGDPSLLTALPGTPLYLRMKLSKRLRDGKLGLGGFKYQTNIKYLKSKEQIISDFVKFSSAFNSGEFQFTRLSSFYECLPQSMPTEGKKKNGFSNLASAFKIIMREKKSLYLFFKRFFLLFFSLDRIRFITKAFFLTKKLSKEDRPLWFYFKFWLFNWSNSIIKYSTLSASDFDIGTIDENFDWEQIIPDGYESDIFEPIPLHKIKMQRKTTIDSLKKLTRPNHINASQKNSPSASL